MTPSWCNWRAFGKVLVVLAIVLWAASVVLDFVGNTKFIGHMTMLALVLTAMGMWRSDEPTPDK